MFIRSPDGGSPASRLVRRARGGTRGVENISGYVYDHTRCGPRRWHQLETGQRGPFFVSTVNGPRCDDFLRFVRSYVEKKSVCDPLDGQVHGLEEVTRWIGIRELALRFIGLGVILGVFQLVEPWIRCDEEGHEQMLDRLKREDGARFRSSASHVASTGFLVARAVTRSIRGESCQPIVITASAEHLWATLPSSSSTTSPRSRLWSRNARRPTFSDVWPTGRSRRLRRG